MNELGLIMALLDSICNVVVAGTLVVISFKIK